VNPNQALWEKGDFTRIAATMRTSGEALVDRLGITDGLEVLDLGCGDGPTAVPAARRGADVLGVDIARNLRISSAYSPPPPDGFVSPMTWGVVDDVVQRFAAAGVPEDHVVCEPDTFVFEAPVPPTEYLTWFRDFYGPTMNAFEAAA